MNSSKTSVNVARYLPSLITVIVISVMNVPNRTAHIAIFHPRCTGDRLGLVCSASNSSFYGIIHTLNITQQVLVKTILNQNRPHHCPSYESKCFLNVDKSYSQFAIKRELTVSYKC